MIEETEADLRRLNEQIPTEENRANRLFFEERLAWVFAMRRAPGMLDSREMFLLSLKPDGNRTCDPESIRITHLGKKRALVDCLVKTNNETFHNTRLFILDGDGRWKLLAWANERAHNKGGQRRKVTDEQKYPPRTRKTRSLSTSQNKQPKREFFNRIGC